jgi:hypothetical protein
MTDPESYRIDASERVRDRVRVLIFRAVRKGLIAELSAALTAMTSRLAADPTSWGDPYSRLRALDLLMYRRLEGPIIVYYAVDQARRIVYVRNVLPFPGRGLESVP